MTPSQPEQSGTGSTSRDTSRHARAWTRVRRVGRALGQVGLAVVSPADLLVPTRPASSTSAAQPEPGGTVDRPDQYERPVPDAQPRARTTRLRAVGRALGQAALAVVSPADLFVPAPRRRPRPPEQ